MLIINFIEKEITITPQGMVRFISPHGSEN